MNDQLQEVDTRRMCKSFKRKGHNLLFLAMSIITLLFGVHIGEMVGGDTHAAINSSKILIALENKGFWLNKQSLAQLEMIKGQGSQT